MARIRSIKPEFWDDEKLAQLPRDVRLLYIGMWTFSDDFGVIKANPVWIKSKVFPYDDIQLAAFKKWLEVLERPGFSGPGGTVSWAVRFEKSGEAFYYLPNFSRHQKVDHPSITNRNPEAPKEIIEAWSPVSRQSREGSRNPLRVLEGIGSEGKGEDAPPPVGGIPPPKASPPEITQAHHNRARIAFEAYPIRAKDGRAVRKDLAGMNLLASKIATHPEFEWEEACGLEGVNDTPQDLVNWLQTQPDPVMIETRRKQKLAPPPLKPGEKPLKKAQAL